MKRVKQDKVKVVTWSTEKVDEWKANAENGIIKGKSPFFKGDFRRAYTPFNYTPDEIAELYKCKTDILYYAEHYCYIMTGTKGYQKVSLFPYQKKILRSYMDNRFNIVLTSRQMGKTVTASIFLLWYSTFHPEKTVGLLSNKAQSAEEIADKIREIMQRLPYFLQPGVVVMNSKNMKFDNGSRIICQGTTKNSFIGFTVHVLYCDEFAHVQPNMLDSFYENAMPTISSMADSKIIITSTPNGMNLFYRIYEDACNGQNSYTPIRVDWWERPGRDQAWMEATLKDVGGEASFMRQYGNSFLDTSNLLLGTACPALVKNKLNFVESYQTNLYSDAFRWHPDFNVESLRDASKRFLISVDIAEGAGKDYSVLQIFETSLSPEYNEDIRKRITLRQVGVWRCNTMAIPQFAEVLYDLSTELMLPFNHQINIEWNKYGELLYTDLFLVDGDLNMMENSAILNYNEGGRLRGVDLNRASKDAYCQMFRAAVFDGRIQICENETVTELINFGRREGSTSYAAITGHDDMAMACVTTAAVFDNKRFRTFIEDIDTSEVPAFDYDIFSSIS